MATTNHARRTQLQPQWPNLPQSNRTKKNVTSVISKEDQKKQTWNKLRIVPMSFHPFINFSLLVVTNLNLQLVRLAPALFVYLSQPRTHRPSRETKAFARVGIMSGCAVLCFQKTAPRQPARNDDRKLEFLRSSACFFRRSLFVCNSVPNHRKLGSKDAVAWYSQPHILWLRSGLHRLRHIKVRDLGDTDLVEILAQWWKSRKVII